MGKARPPGKSGVSGAPDSPPHRPHAGQSCFCSRVLRSYKLPPILGCSFLVTCRSRLQKLGSQGQLRASGGAFAPGETLTSAPPRSHSEKHNHESTWPEPGTRGAGAGSLSLSAGAGSGHVGGPWLQGSDFLGTGSPGLRGDAHGHPGIYIQELVNGAVPTPKTGASGPPVTSPCWGPRGTGCPRTRAPPGTVGLHGGGGMPGGGGAASSGRGWAAPKWTARRPQHTSLGVPGAREPLLEVLWLWAVMQRLPGLPRCQLCTRLPQVDWAHGPLSLSPQKPRVHCKTRLLFSSSFRV